jgi:hypothetical protein
MLLPPGEFEYKYILDDIFWAHDESQVCADNQRVLARVAARPEWQSLPRMCVRVDLSQVALDTVKSVKMHAARNTSKVLREPSDLRVRIPRRHSQKQARQQGK